MSKKADWNIPAAAITKLITRNGTAEAAPDIAKNETTRTPVANARRREAFDALIAPGETPPTNPKDLHEIFFTKRKKDVIEFRDSGKTVYMTVQVENDGKKGNWGPMVSAPIP
jgi:hypothetical protein